MSREEIKRVAAEMFAAQGFHATTLRGLAKQSGMTLGTLYHYYPSKEDLLLELIDDSMKPLMESIPFAEQEAANDPPGVLRWMVRRFILGTLDRLSTATISETELRALNGNNLRHAIGKRDAYQVAMEHVLQQGIDQGVFRVTQLKITVFAILSVCNGVFRWYRPDGALDAEAVADLHADLILRLVGYDSDGEQSHS